MTLLQRFYRITVDADNDPQELKRVAPEISEANRSSVVIFSLVCLLFLLIMVVVSFLLPQLQNSRYLYLSSAVVVGLIFYLAHTRAKGNELLTLILMYSMCVMMLMFGIVLGTVNSPHELCASYIALMLTMPQMFTDRPWRMYALIFSSVAVFIVMVVLYKDPITWSSDIINALVFGGVSSVCCTYMMKIKVERFCLVDTVRHMAETDQLTGLRNRNSYEQRLVSSAILGAKSIFCVYVDANGLHELNNTQGHAAGDRMLQYIATAMQNIFGRGDTYRIGGDEFVAFGVDKDEELMSKMVVRLKQAVESAGYHVAVGMEHRSMDNLEIGKLISQAEQKMYRDKNEYYAANGIEHKRR